MTRTQPLSAIKDPADWSGEAFGQCGGWRYDLSMAEIDGLRAMADMILPKLGQDPNRLLSLEKEAFDLGPFTARLGEIYNGLKSGLGIALIRGLPVAQMEMIEIATIYWGIGRHLGTATPNNPEGDMLGHITDLGKTQADANSRGYQTRETMDYHCDQCDLVGLICLRAAKSGGVSMVASSVAMYNELLRRNPEYAEALTAPLCWSKHGEYAPGEDPFYTSPVFNFFGETLCTSFGPKHILKGHDLPQAPDLTDLQRDALRVAEEIAHELRFDMVLEPGDMQFANNYVALHTRSEFHDHDDPAQKRLLWRLWLMNEDLRPRTAYAMQWHGGVSLGAGRRQIRL